MEIVKQLKGLESLYTNSRMVLSLYLSNDHSNDYQKRDIWRIHLKNGLKDIEKNIMAVGNSIEIQSFRLVKQKVEKELNEHKLQFKRGFVLFASQDKVVYKDLQVPVDNEFYWRDEPVIDPLESLYKKFPRSGIVAFNHEHAQILDVELGEVKDSQLYDLEVDQENWRKIEGRAPSSITNGKVKHHDRDRYDKRLHENMVREFKALAHQIDKTAYEKGWEGVYLAGVPDMLPLLQGTLYVQILKTSSQNLVSKTPQQIVQELLLK
ncbi:VLRF1 family aeRF1-type release factor [Bacillus marinisedimentorum]|uniref:VLRF1 family aeRF1-type release factor n=1 Tax=Bacillus marinisedimentorum TaxID=1821260 RepID=UPI000872E2D0|nr:VLRF1 family aeRF1-type release factor [Bacillus marinisedimentorum]